jgi:hypothetical protein
LPRSSSDLGFVRNVETITAARGARRHDSVAFDLPVVVVNLEEVENRGFVIPTLERTGGRVLF